jgi:hypothetical protein
MDEDSIVGQEQDEGKWPARARLWKSCGYPGIGVEDFGKADLVVVMSGGMLPGSLRGESNRNPPSPKNARNGALSADESMTVLVRQVKLRG